MGSQSDASIETLLQQAVFASDSDRATARTAIRKLAASRGIWLASILPFYQARAQAAFRNLTVPAMNVRGLGYEFCSAIFRAAIAGNVGAFIIEIAQSEIEYTDQRPDEVAVIALAAAIREKYRGPIFLQGDHYKVHQPTDPGKLDDEVRLTERLVDESLEAGMYNIDIDTSAFVDLAQTPGREQQSTNAELTARLVRRIREREPFPVSIGGEIGEIGGKVSTPEDLRGFMEGLKDRLAGMSGISKVAVQTGTSHGGVLNPDGTAKEVPVNMDALKELSRIAREEYGMAGAVQHGASTLPEETIKVFPTTGCAEIHLSTGFQDVILDHREFPRDLLQKMEEYVKERFGGDRLEGQTDAQFIRKHRRKAWGQWKRQLADLPQETLRAIGESLEEKISQYFFLLHVTETRQLVDRFVQRSTIG